MHCKANIENQDPAQVEFSDKQVAKSLLGADPGVLASCSQVQEYYHSVKVHPFADGRQSLDGKNVLIEKIEAKPFIELTIRSEGFVPKPRNESLPVHFIDVLE